MRRLGLTWDRAVEAWKGAFGLGTLSWASYGTFVTCVIGASPGRDAGVAFAAGALLGAWLGSRPQGAGSRQTLT